MYFENKSSAKRPSIKEVAGEMFADTREVINVENVMSFISGATLGPYCILTHIKSTNLAGVIGLALGAVGQGILYWDLADGGYGYTKLALIPIATNIASGVCEWYQHTERKIIERKKNSGLEEVTDGKSRSWTQCRTGKGKGC